MPGWFELPAKHRNRYISPDSGWRGRWQDRLANATGLRRLRRAILSRLPFMVLASDVRDIVYANWIVPVGKVAHLMPQGITLLERDGHTILTILTYRHGHFGPAFLGPLRRLFPSPLQSNWRLYLAPDANEGRGTVLFIANIFDSALYAVGTRLFSDVLPSHRAARFDHHCTQTSGMMHIGGGGSAPEVRIEAVTDAAAILPPDFQRFFPSWRQAIQYLALQHQAVAQVADEDALVFSDIDLPIEPDSATALGINHYEAGPWLKELGALNAPFCFRVPSVHFKALSEQYRPARQT